MNYAQAAPAAPTMEDRHIRIGKAVQEAYIQQGDLPKAEAFEKYWQKESTLQTNKQLAVLNMQFQNAIQTGDLSGLGENIAKVYNGLPDDVRQGARFQRLDYTQDAKGGVSGISATFKNKGGKTIVHNWDGMQSFGKTMTGYLNPVALFEHAQATFMAGDKAKLEIAKHRGQKEIDAGVSVEQKLAERNLGLSGKSPTDRYNEAEKAPSEVDTGWLEKKPDERDALVRERLGRAEAYERSVAPGIAGGGTAAPAPKPGVVVLDAKTNKPGSVVMDPKTNTPVFVPADGGAAPAQQGAPATPAAAPPATPASITAPRPGSQAPAATTQQGFGIPGIGAVNEGVQSGYDLAPEQPAAPQAQQPAPVQAGPKRRVQMPQSGPTPLPNGGYSDEGRNQFADDAVRATGEAAQATGEAVVSAGKSMGETVTNMPEVRAAKAAGQAILKAMPQIGTDRGSQIDAARRSAGLPARKGKGPMFQAGEHIDGLEKQGNIDLSTRPEVRNTDGTVSTVRSISIGVGDKTILIPTVVKGKVVSDEEAIKHYKSSGQHLGVFKDQQSADAYAETLHEQQAGQSKPKDRPQARSAPGLGLGG